MANPRATLFGSSAPASTAEMDIDDLVESLSKVSVQDTVRAAITSNDNFADMCSQMSSMQVSTYRENTLKEADLIAKRVEEDLNKISQKNIAEEDKLEIVYVVQAYMRCLELDIEKWKNSLKLSGMSEQEIAEVDLTVREFRTWEQRKHSAPQYNENQLQKPKDNTIVGQIEFVQFALNYWRSCYLHISDYEKLLNQEKYTTEKKLWRLEQISLSYMLVATENGRAPQDINHTRLREPKNIDPHTGKPMSIAGIREMIQQQEREVKYKL